MAITWKRIKDLLDGFTPEQLNDTATVWDAPVDEYCHVDDTLLVDESQDVLDPGHMVLVINRGY